MLRGTLLCSSIKSSTLLSISGPHTSKSLDKKTLSTESHSPPFFTHYEILGLQRSASQKEIKEAYLKLSKEYHPDVIGDDWDREKCKFIAVNEAYSTLSRSDKKRIYDLGLFKEEIKQNEHVHAGYYQRPMTFDERRKAYGYPDVNPHIYANQTETYKIAFGCLIFAIFGYVVHYSIAKMTFNKHRRVLEETTRKHEMSFEAAKREAQSLNSVGAQWEAAQKRMR